jgi:hypothetical protein
MTRVKIEDDGVISQLLALASSMGMGTAGLESTKIAFDSSVRYIQGVWKGWALGNTIIGISNIRRPNGKLAQSIGIKRNGPLDAEIYTESPYAQRIQDGQPELDMKTTHPFGKKSRVSKEGIPYLIVPFRWGTPNQEGKARAHFGNFIPVPMFDEIKALKTSKRLAKYDKEGNITGGETHFEANYSGEDIERSEYNWGGRYKGEGNMNGMVRMSGGGGYFTFRVISAKQLVTSPYSWIRKAIPPVDVVSALENQVRPVVKDVIQAGLEADIGL